MNRNNKENLSKVCTFCTTAIIVSSVFYNLGICKDCWWKLHATPDTPTRPTYSDDLNWRNVSMTVTGASATTMTTTSSSSSTSSTTTTLPY